MEQSRIRNISSMNIQQVPDWKIKFLKGGYYVLKCSVYECIKYLNKTCTKAQIVNVEIARAIQQSQPKKYV